MSAAATFDPLTEEGTVLGTVGYMSPEQVRGHNADHRSDIFSFGAVLYEMLTGQRAFKGRSAVETLNAILKEEPPQITVANPPLPPALERIVYHCLEKNPAERFQSAHDLAFDIEALSSPSGSGPRAALARRRVPVAARAPGAAGGADHGPARRRLPARPRGAAPPEPGVPAADLPPRHGVRRALRSRRPGRLLRGLGRPQARALRAPARDAGRPRSSASPWPRWSASRPPARWRCSSHKEDKARPCSPARRWPAGRRARSSSACRPRTGRGTAPTSRSCATSTARCGSSTRSARVLVSSASGHGISHPRISPEGRPGRVPRSPRGLRRPRVRGHRRPRGAQDDPVVGLGQHRGAGLGEGRRRGALHRGQGRRRLRALRGRPVRQAAARGKGARAASSSTTCRRDGTLLLERNSHRMEIRGLVDGQGGRRPLVVRLLGPRRPLRGRQDPAVLRERRRRRLAVLGVRAADRRRPAHPHRRGPRRSRCRRTAAPSLSHPPRRARRASTILPTGAGEVRTVQHPAIEHYRWAQWLPDGKRILFSATEPKKPVRLYVHDLETRRDAAGRARGPGRHQDDGDAGRRRASSP